MAEDSKMLDDINMISKDVSRWYQDDVEMERQDEVCEICGNDFYKSQTIGETITDNNNCHAELVSGSWKIKTNKLSENSLNNPKNSDKNSSDLIYYQVEIELPEEIDKLKKLAQMKKENPQQKEFELDGKIYLI